MTIVRFLCLLFCANICCAQAFELTDVSASPQDLNYFLASIDINEIEAYEIGGNVLRIFKQCDIKTTPSHYFPESHQCWINLYFSLTNDGEYVSSSLHLINGILNPEIGDVKYLSDVQQIAVAIIFGEENFRQRKVIMLDRRE